MTERDDAGPSPDRLRNRRVIAAGAGLASLAALLTIAFTQGSSGHTKTAATTPTTRATPRGTPQATTRHTTARPKSTVVLSPTCSHIAHIATLTQAQQLSQLVLIGVDSAGQATAALDGGASGIYLIGKSTWIASDTLKRLAANASFPPTIAADEEGGRVSRIAAEFGPMPSAYALGSMPPATVQSIAAQRAKDLVSLGINTDLAPDTDLYDPSNAAIGDRSFGATPDQVIIHAGAFLDGLRQAGIVGVIKHFPGHGHSSGDSQTAVVHTSPLAQMEGADLIPFARLANKAPAVMVGHLDVPGLTEPGRPSSLSPASFALLRQRLGFRGYILTDDLTMSAVTDRFSVANAAVAAIAAGADGVLVTDAHAGELATVVAALTSAARNGTISQARLIDALSHVQAVKSLQYHCSL